MYMMNINVYYVHSTQNYFKELAIDSFRKSGEYFKLKCPLTGEAKIGKNWCETHYLSFFRLLANSLAFFLLPAQCAFWLKPFGLLQSIDFLYLSDHAITFCWDKDF